MCLILICTLEKSVMVMTNCPCVLVFDFEPNISSCVSTISFLCCQGSGSPGLMCMYAWSDVLV